MIEQLRPYLELGQQRWQQLSIAKNSLQEPALPRSSLVSLAISFCELNDA